MVQQGLPRSGTPPAFPRRRGLPEKRKIRDVKKVVAVSSAKGGVGKSTVAGGLKAFSLSLSAFNQPSPIRAPFDCVDSVYKYLGDGEVWTELKISPLLVNLALAFARRGIKAGILDTDIFGPSIPTLLNLSGEPRLDESKI